MSLTGVSATRTHVVLKTVKNIIPRFADRSEKERREETWNIYVAMRRYRLQAIGHNIGEVRKRLAPGVKLMAVIKADAYGHGACRVGKYLESQVDYFAVATLEEALELRESGITRPI